MKNRRSLSSSIPSIINHSIIKDVMSFSEYLNLALTGLIQNGHTVESLIEVKVPADGAPFYRSSSFVMVSFSFLSLDPHTSSATGNYTCMHYNNNNNYEFYRNSHTSRNTGSRELQFV